MDYEEPPRICSEFCHTCFDISDPTICWCGTERFVLLKLIAPPADGYCPIVLCMITVK